MGVIQEKKSQRQDVVFDQDTHADRGRLQVCKEGTRAPCLVSESDG